MAKANKHQLDYIREYNKQNYVIVRLSVSKKTEPELLEFLSQKENKSGYIKSLILKDMKEGK